MMVVSSRNLNLKTYATQHARNAKMAGRRPTAGSAQERRRQARNDAQ
jgi:hypothetical protein